MIMKRHHRFILAGFMILFLSALGCGPSKTQVPSKSVAPACIQGTVWYVSPIDTSKVRFAYAEVNAWRHDTNQPLAKTKADKQGNYCIEVPLGDYRVDLRVWGLRPLRGKDYTCKGSKDHIDLGATSKRCGADCTKVDIVTECREYVYPMRRTR
jgi:hypothetical protein